jgi:hypothetical protein
MTAYQYCTPEWFEALEKAYQADSTYEQQFKNLSLILCFRVRAESSWGIDSDIIFGAHLEEGRLTRLGFFSEQEAARDATFVLSATPQNWKKLLRRETKFVTDFMLGRIKLEQGSSVAVMKLAPLSDKLVNFMSSQEIQFPDEMSPDEIENYRSRMEEFRANV